MLLLNILVKDFEAPMSHVLRRRHQWNLFSGDFPLCSECFKFASHLTKSIFRSLYVMAVSFQMPVALYCVLM